jgi:hypothetical protein
LLVAKNCCHGLQALIAHAINVWDKALLFRSAATFSNAGALGQLLAVLAVKGSCRLSLPVLKENLGKVLRGVGGIDGTGLGRVVHISSYEEVPDSSDSDAVGVGSDSFYLWCAQSRHLVLLLMFLQWSTCLYRFEVEHAGCLMGRERLWWGIHWDNAYQEASV